MFKMVDDTLVITKGDSGSLAVNLKKNDGTPYVMASGDTLTFTARKKPGSPVLMQIVSTSNTITFTPAQTKLLAVGSIVFDIELKTSNSDVFTVVGLKNQSQSNLTVLPEVTE